MRIKVSVKTNSCKEKLEKIDNFSYKVWVNKPPIDGKANQELIGILAKYFKVSKSSVILFQGEKNKIKIFEILTS